MDIRKMLNKRFGNAKGYEDGVIYTEVLKDTVYKTYQNGVVRYKKRAVDDIVIPAAEIRSNLEWLVPKIPFKYYLMTLDFYKDVNEKFRTEACVLFFWNKDNIEIPQELLDLYGSGIIQDGQLIVIAPKQQNSGALSQYVERTTENGVSRLDLTPMVRWLEDNTVCILETHSHNSMAAFWSGTDDSNERHSRLRLYAVIGKVNVEEMVKARVHLLGDYFDLAIEDIFDMPKLKLMSTDENELLDVSEYLPTVQEESYYTGPFKYSATHPESWFELFSVTPLPRHSVSQEPKSKGSLKNWQTKGFKASNFEFLDEEETEPTVDVYDENGELLADLEDEDFLDENGNFDHNLQQHGAEKLFMPKKPNKGIMSMSDAEFKNFTKKGHI